ncbi:TPR-like protein [Dioscorea alata]|uniref:TPR-like protein n=1 Tax=Dioscorea alata TaxID=55571 RepID=A0ACB7W9P7_DIOAL|nr:TPR-like protein [Dioscorea alata]
MRNAWRSLLVQSLHRIPSNSLRIQPPNLHFVIQRPLQPCASGSFLSLNSRFRFFSSDSTPDCDGRDQALAVEIFSKPIGSGEIEAELEAAKLSLDNKMLNLVLRSVEDRPEIARKVFDWVLEKQNRLLSSKSYNLMLGILGSDGDSEGFWASVEIMKKNGYGISKGAYLKALEGFNRKGMEKDSSLLERTYFLNSHENVVVRACPRVCKILSECNESEEVYKNLNELEIILSSDLILAVLDRIGSDPRKALMFFRWAEKKPSFRVDGSIYNALARVCGREDCIDEFRVFLQKMKNEGFEMEKETYVKVSDRFYKRKMIIEAVELFEFAMHGSEKPQDSDLLLLLRKIAVSKELDMDLISRAVRIYSEKAGQSVKASVFSRVLKSLASVGKLGDCDEVLKAMEAGGFVPDHGIYAQVVVQLFSLGRLDKALVYMDGLEKLGHTKDADSWAWFLLCSSIQKHCKARKLDKALSLLHEMIEIRGAAHIDTSVDVLVSSYCHNNKVDAALKILKEMVTKKQLQLSYDTRKILIEKLVSKGKLREASRRMFATLLEAGRYELAYGLLYESPGSGSVYHMKPEEAALSVAV